MSTSSEIWTVLGYPADPIPGDPGVVRTYAAEYAKVAQAIGDASTRLRSIADSQGSQSEFVNKFRDQATEVASKIAKAKTRYAGVASAVGAYASPLEDAQNRANSALGLATTAWDTHQTNSLLVEKYQNELTYNTSLSDSEKQHYTQLLHHAQTQVTDSLHDINSAKSMLQAAMDARDNAANHASNQIQNVQDTGGINDDAWQQFWDKNKTLIDTIVSVIEVVATVVLIVLMFIPGVDLIVTIIMVVVAVIEIAKAISEWSAGVESPGSAILDIVLALVPFAGAAAGKMAVKVAVNAAVKTELASKAGQAISKFTTNDALADIAEKTAPEIDHSAGGIIKSVVKTLAVNEADKVEMLQKLAKASLVVGGKSARIEAIANRSAWIIKAIPGPVAEPVLEAGLHQALDPIFDKMAGMSN